MAGGCIQTLRIADYWLSFDATTCVATFKGHGKSVSSIAFSRDGQQLASASDDGTVKLWDAATGQCLQTFSFQKIFSSLSFDATGLCLCTDIGTICLDKASVAYATTVQAPPHHPRFRGFSISADEAWITQDGQKLLWLPPEYRPTWSAVTGSTMALGCASRRVLFLRFFGEEVAFP